MPVFTKPIYEIQHLGLRRGTLWFCSRHEKWLREGLASLRELQLLHTVDTVWFHDVVGVRLHDTLQFPNATALVVSSCCKHFVARNCLDVDLRCRFHKLDTLVMYSRPCDMAAPLSWRSGGEHDYQVLVPRHLDRLLDEFLEEQHSNFLELQPEDPRDAVRQVLDMDAEPAMCRLFFPPLEEDGQEGIDRIE